MFKNKPLCLVSPLPLNLNWGVPMACPVRSPKRKWKRKSIWPQETWGEGAESHPSDKVQMKNKKPQLNFQRDGCCFWDLYSNAQIWKHYSQVVEFGICQLKPCWHCWKSCKSWEGKIIIGTKIMLLKDLWCHILTKGMKSWNFVRVYIAKEQPQE